MRRFTSPLEPSIGVRHYLLGLVAILIGVYFLGGSLMGILVSANLPAGETLDSLSNVQSLFSKNEFFSLNMIPFVLGVLTIVFCSRLIFKRSFKTFLTARPRFDFARFFFSFGLWSILMLVSFFITFIDFSHHLIWNFQCEHFFYLLLLAVILVPIQTGFEEILFRGFLLQLVGKVTQKGIYLILINGILFCALHLMNPEIATLGIPAAVYYIVSGIFTSFIAVMDDGIELSWGFHLANNLFGIIIVTNNWQVIQTDALFMDVSPPAFGWDIYVTMFLFYPLMILVFWLVYRWKNWNKVLL
ncbi:CPBP family intramembrane glutamic endopeptidase [Fluviicola taffensis]|uniref:CPBP family intramembrane glutamic endopeptidase n=1 Tax=Fluviicola taffensis TaxID=191579 RepID=UPI00313811D8